MKSRHANFRILTGIWSALTAILLCGCHKTIHIHPWETNEKVRLTLHVSNDAPQLGAIIDYTVNPAVIIYSDRLPEKAINKSAGIREPSTDKFNSIETHVKDLSEEFERIAPYLLDGDNWEMHLKYEVYKGDFDAVKSEHTPLLAHEVIYRADESHPIHEVDLDIPFGTVTVVAVAHIVPAGHNDDYFFNTNPLHTIISNIDRRNGRHDNVYRDCFVVAQQFHTEPTGIDNNVQYLEATLTRPQGRYIVLADDYEEYLKIANVALGEAGSEIYYPSYINISYSLLSKLPLASSYNFGYESPLSLIEVKGNPYVRIGDDWSFVNGNRSNFNIDISVKQKSDDTQISSNPGILVPIFPEMVTLVVGHWLTETIEGGGGVSVDPNFTDEIVIHF